MPTPDLGVLGYVLAGAGIVLLVWAAVATPFAEARTARAREDEAADRYDPDADQRRWLIETHGGSDEPLV